VSVSGFAILQLALAFILCEVGLRVIYPHSRNMRMLLYEPTGTTRFDDIDSLPELLDRSIRGYRPFSVSSGFVLNSRGLRTKEYANGKEPGAYRVLAIGDSFTHASGGLPHPHHWPTLLEEGLAKRRGDRVEVLRLGVGGTETQFQLRLWQLEGTSLDADAVVLGFFVGDDFFRGGQGLERRLPQDTSQRLASASLTYRLSRNLRRVWRGAERQAVEKGFSPHDAPDQGGHEILAYRDDFDPDAAHLTPKALLQIEVKRMSLTRRDREEVFRVLFEGAGETLKSFHTEVTQAGAEFVVLIIPDQFQVDSEIRDAVLRETDSALGDYDLDRAQRMLEQFLTANDIDHIDLLPVFRQIAKTERLYRIGNTHWNAAGNRLAAKLLLEFSDQRSD
jgi:hypothetical protein